MQRKRKKKIENQNLLREKKRNQWKKLKVEPFSLVIFPNILTKDKIFYFKINSVKSKRKKKKARTSSKQLLYLKERKKCLLSPNKNNDLWHINSLPKKKKEKKAKKLVKLQEDNKSTSNPKKFQPGIWCQWPVSTILSKIYKKQTENM